MNDFEVKFMPFAKRQAEISRVDVSFHSDDLLAFWNRLSDKALLDFSFDFDPETGKFILVIYSIEGH